MPIPRAPFTNITMEFIDGLPKSKGKEVVFMVVDRFRKYTHFMILTHLYTTIFVAKGFMDNESNYMGFQLQLLMIGI